VVNAVIEQYLSDLDAHKSVDILYLARKIKFLDEILKDEKHKNLIALYKRSTNILAIEEKKDGLLLQNLVFQVGRNHGFETKMRDWFLALYQILLGQEQGPRVGSFIALFGVENFLKLVEEKMV
jgi:lysyl-tRNA synthetase class 1